MINILLDDKSKKLDDILEYACEEEYLVVEVINDIKSYKLNNMVENKVCSTCSERLYSFVPEDFKVGKEYVDRSTFESLATELFDFKKYVELELQRLGVRREDRDELTDVKEENKDLKLDLLSKEKLINLLLEKICDKPNLGEEKCKQIDFDINTEFQSKKKFQHIDNRWITTRKKNANYSKDSKESKSYIPLQNSFNGLHEVDSGCNDAIDENDSESNFFQIKGNKGTSNSNSTNYRPANVINNFPENDKLHITKKPVKHVPASNNYAGSTREGKKICVIGDSIIQRIKIKDINKQFKKLYPGGTVEEIEWNAQKVLEKKDIDSVILNMGSNNVSSKHTLVTAEIGIVNKILKTVDLCYRNGVNNVFVLGITCCPEFQEKIDKINEYLKNGTGGMRYTFIDNSNIIASKHLWDQVHLNNDGLRVLKINFLGVLNTCLH